MYYIHVPFVLLDLIIVPFFAVPIAVPDYSKVLHSFPDSRQMADERYYNTDEQRDQGEAEWAEVSTSRFPHGPSLNDKLYVG